MYNPAETPFGAVPSSSTRMERLQQLNQERGAEIQQLEEHRKKYTTLHQFLRSALFLALLAGLITIVLLYLVNPSFTQNKNKSRLETGKQNFWKALLVAGIVAALVYFGPLLYEYLSRAETK